MSGVAIIDFGSQLTQLIARQIREIGVYCEIFQSSTCLKSISEFECFVFSGGPQSVTDINCETDRRIAFEIIKLNEKTRIPILGICYGHQLICHCFGVRVEKGSKREFGRTKIKIIKESPIIKNIWKQASEADVLMSHSDSIENVPHGFSIIALGVASQAVAIIANEHRRIYCTQFHPEVKITSDGKKLMSNFLDIANCKRDWTIKSIVEEQKRKIKALVEKSKVIAAVSGGVDSSVAATLTYNAIGKQLNCIFIDTGLLRTKEENFLLSKEIPVKYINRSELFLKRLKGITDPERKREIIGNTFVEVFEEEAKRIGDVDFLMQGTIYSDVIESGHTSLEYTNKIKSHHNVGGLPKKMNLKLVEPLRYLFKDEVRTLGEEIGLSDEMVLQHPFPGTGLAIRIIGEVNEERVRILRSIDNIYINLMKNYCLYNKIWQAFAVLLPIKTVGIIGDSRTYRGYVCALRAITSYDGMTADTFPFDDKSQYSLVFWDFLQNVSSSIINNIPEVNRVVYDLTPKPPSTIEWE